MLSGDRTAFQSGSGTYSVYQMVRYHKHNVKLVGDGDGDGTCKRTSIVSVFRLLAILGSGSYSLS